MNMDAHLYSVKQLTQELRHQLESNYSRIKVEGEISGLANPASGHLYFSLKEENAVIRCAFFKHNNRKLKFTPENGMQVIAHGQLSLYEGRGDLQLIVNHLEDSGEGKLALEFERLKKALLQKGLFDSEHKSPLPPFPNTIGIVSSPTGAAIQDVMVTLKRRYPLAEIKIFPTAVQGEEAPVGIAKMLELANQQSVDVIILTRGGGSLEDLHAFNTQSVAQAIFDSKIPVISGVGHEIDFTIADLVADVRAATPTAAAESATPDRQTLLRNLTDFSNRLFSANQKHLNFLQQNLDFNTRNLQHPAQKIDNYQMILNHLTRQMKFLLHESLLNNKSAHQKLNSTIRLHSPSNKIVQLKNRTEQLKKSLIMETNAKIKHLMQRSLSKKENLEIMNPQNTLDRGYAILTGEDNKVISKASLNLVNQNVTALVSSGSLNCKVESIKASK